jgi:hypothetical protein
MNTSATGGYLRESVSVPHHKTLEDAAHGMITGLTGLDSKLVRPAFQEYPLATPEPDVDWCAFYIRDSSAANYPDVRHSPDDGGSDIVTDWQNKEIHLYFYGPDCGEYAGMVRRGLHVEQNYLEFRKSGIVVKRVGNVAQMPEKVNEKWVSRADLIIYAAYAVSVSYPVLDVSELSDGGQIWTVVPPTPDDDGSNPSQKDESWEEERPGSGSFLNINR